MEEAINIPPKDLSKYSTQESSVETQDLIEYAEKSVEADEEIYHIEKIKGERFQNQELEVWDVFGKKQRYWIITKPALNIYEQKAFHSMDVAISFHVGLLTRMAERDDRKIDLEKQGRLLETWRRHGFAVDVLNDGMPEDFQSIATQCRETLLCLIKNMTNSGLFEGEKVDLKIGDFKSWSQLIADKIAAGESNSRKRSYLKAIARESWDLVSSAVHKSSLTVLDVWFFVSATEGVISSFEICLLRYEAKAPSKCPRCSSSKIHVRFDIDDERYVHRCLTCNWTE